MQKDKLLSGLKIAEKFSIDTAILELLSFQMQIKILHWQTTSYAQHMAFGGIYDFLNDAIDKFVEVYQGKYGRIKFGETEIEFDNIINVNIKKFVSDFESYLTGKLPTVVDTTSDTDLLNLRDEILSETKKLKYLLTLD